MKYRTFGRLGWKVSQIGFGAWQIGALEWPTQQDDDSLAALHKALDLDCNFIDTARVYGNGRSERLIARVLRERKSEDVFVATKIPPRLPGDWPPSPYDTVDDRYPETHVRHKLEESLRELQTDCIDLVQIHTWSLGWNDDPRPLFVLKQLQLEGKLRGIGVSTPEHDQNSAGPLIHSGLVDSIQVIYNVFDQEAQAAIFPAAVKNNVAVIVRVPLDESGLGGKLTPATAFAKGDIRRKYFEGDRLDRTVRRIDKINQTIDHEEPNVAKAALKFAKAEMNCARSATPSL
jgi:aryl-alcohol dehydrogenase-like predicted oxidoreductase